MRGDDNEQWAAAGPVDAICIDWAIGIFWLKKIVLYLLGIYVNIGSNRLQSAETGCNLNRLQPVFLAEPDRMQPVACSPVRFFVM